MKVLILAGGEGSRLWPLSKNSYPKQFIHFFDGESLLQKTISRFIEMPFVEDITVITNAAYQTLVEEQIKGMERVSVLIEPCSRNTAPAIRLCFKISPREL